MGTWRIWLQVGLVVVFMLGASLGAAQGKRAVLLTGFKEWQASSQDFSGWQLSGVRLHEGALVLNPTTAVLEADPYPPGGYYEANFYTGGTYRVGEAVSPASAADFDFDELIASWNAATPAGSWVEILARVDLGSHWTKWYNLGVWASGYETVRRHSVKDQADEDGKVAVDTVVITDKKAAARGFQIKVRLFSVDGVVSPSVRGISAAYSTTPVKNSQPSAGNPANWDRVLDVPACSQMVYPDGGNVWCSPTSTSMVVSYWQGTSGPCAPAVYAAVEGVFDWVYDGHGNWPFNTAYAGGLGLNASVRRFTSLDEVETWIARGVPVVISISWGKGQLDGAPIPSSGGHLIVVVGFDAQGNPVVNDPAAASDEEVRRTYLRSQLEAVWLENSGGLVYLIQR